MIENFFNYYNQSRVIIAFGCKKKESFDLLKEWSSKQLQTSILSPKINSLVHPIPANQAVFVVDLHCEGVDGLFHLADNSSLFASPFKWIIHFETSKATSTDIIEKHFSNIDILQDSDVTLAALDSNGSYAITKIYSRGLNLEILTEDIGYWSVETGFVDKEFEPITARRRSDLQGTTLKTCIVITHNDSLNHLTDKRDKHIDSIAKVNYVLVEHLSGIINATLNYSIQNTWGYKDKIGTWNGMIGELVRNEADIGGTALFLTEDRVAIIDYIAMTTETRSKFIFRQPKLSYVSNVFILTFDWTVWYSTIALIIVTASVLYAAIKWEWKKKLYVQRKPTSNEPELRDSWADVTFLAYGALCQQGTPTIPYAYPGRITTIFLFISFMFLYTSYSANIVALLQSSSNSIRSLEDLLKSRLDVGVDDTVFNHFYFPNATEPIRKALYERKVAPPGAKPKFMATEKGIRMMREGLFAFHVETGVGYKIIGETFQEAEKCGLHEIQFLQVPDPWLAIQKNSSYKEMLKIGFRSIQESGLQYREHSLIYTRKPQCVSRGATFISVGLIDCYAALAVLAGGIILSALIFLLEYYIHYRAARKHCLIKKLENMTQWCNNRSHGNEVQYLD